MNQPTRIHVVYADVGNGGVVESRDGGHNWRAESGPAGTVLTLVIAPADPATLYVGTDPGLFQRAADGTWNQLPITPDDVILAVAASAVEPGRIAVIDQNGSFYRSDDDGQTWPSD